MFFLGGITFLPCGKAAVLKHILSRKMTEIIILNSFFCFLNDYFRHSLLLLVSFASKNMCLI